MERSRMSQGSRGMTLLELMVGSIIGTLVIVIAFTFYRNLMTNLERQKQVTAMQDGIRNAVDCINRYLIAGGVSGDSLFFDPHRKLGMPMVNGGHRVFEVAADSSSLSVYGNYSGSGATIVAPILDKSQRWFKTDKPRLFKSGGFAYIYAGSAQEVARIVSVHDSIVALENDFFAPYPRGTLIFPLERVRIFRGAGQTLRVARESANGSAIFPREFIPSGRPGDSLVFKVNSLDRRSGQIDYSLTFLATAVGRSKTRLARRSEQTVFVRGF